MAQVDFDEKDAKVTKLDYSSAMHQRDVVIPQCNPLELQGAIAAMEGAEEVVKSIHMSAAMEGAEVVQSIHMSPALVPSTAVDTYLTPI